MNDKNKEIWVPILGLENQYEVSNFGNVKSISRTINVKRKKGQNIRPIKERILNQFLVGKKNNDYFAVKLCVNGRCKTFKVHILMAVSFMYDQYLELVISSNENYLIDHKNEIKTDNRLENLQIITHRQNITKAIIHKNPNKMIGTTKINNKFASRIFTNGVQHHLGVYDTELEAHKAYLKALNEINNGTFTSKKKRKRITPNRIIITPKIVA
jgi:hypothetical protein